MRATRDGGLLKSAGLTRLSTEWMEGGGGWVGGRACFDFQSALGDIISEGVWGHRNGEHVKSKMPCTYEDGRQTRGRKTETGHYGATRRKRTKETSQPAERQPALAVSHNGAVGLILISKGCAMTFGSAGMKGGRKKRI